MSNQSSISKNKVINFGAGPGKLPEEVARTLFNYIQYVLFLVFCFLFLINHIDKNIKI